MAQLRKLSQADGKQSGEDDLSEIKEILHQLQTLDVADVERLRDTAKTRGVEKAAFKTKWIVWASIPLALAGATYIGLEIGVLPRGFEAAPVAGSSPKLSPAEVESLVAKAHELLISGDASGARRILSGATPGEDMNAAFAMAQSYDPNYLKDIPNVNEAPDRFKARYWYRVWYGLAVKSGLAMKKERLDRIIDAMWYRGRAF